jgi:hexosaminidase
MTPAYRFYLDYPQTSEEDSLAANWGGVNTVRTTYDYNPVIPGLKEDEIQYVIGAQANVWTEFINNPDKLEYMMLPRLSAVSELLWSPQDKRSWEDFKIRMDKQYQRYQLWDVKFNPADIEMK